MRFVRNMALRKTSPGGHNKKEDGLSPGMKRKRLPLAFLTLAVLVLCGLNLSIKWHKYGEAASEEAIQLAQSLEAMLHPEHIAEFSGSTADIGISEYGMAKAALTRLVDTTDKIRFAYLLREQNGRLTFLMDSESPDSPDYSPPGQVYEEADDLVREPFGTGLTVITPPVSDRWGTWISALVPVKSPAGGETVAVFGIDFSASEWYAALQEQMIPDIMITAVVLLLYFSMIFILLQQSRLGSLNRKLAFDEAFYRGVFDQAPIGVAIVNDRNFIYRSRFGHDAINPMFEKILGRNSGELSNLEWTEITHPDDLQADLENFNRFIKGEINGYTMEKRFIRPDGSFVWTNMIISPLRGIYDDHSVHLCLIDDITAQKAAEAALRESERRESVLLSHLPGLAYRCGYDPEWTMQFVSEGCLQLTGYAPDSLLGNRDLSYNDLISPEYREVLWNEWKIPLAERKPFKSEYEILTASGERKWVLELGQGIYGDEGKVEALEGIILDISDRKEMKTASDMPVSTTIGPVCITATIWNIC